MKKAIFEIVKEASAIKDDAKRIEYMRANWNITLAYLLHYTFNDTHKFLLPPGAPPYKQSDYPDTHYVLSRELNKLYLFLNTTSLDGRAPPDPKRFTALMRESKFIELLESIHAEDAKILIKVKDKEAWDERLNENFIRLAYPDLLPTKSDELDVVDEKEVGESNTLNSENNEEVSNFEPNSLESIRKYTKEDFYKEKVYKDPNNTTSERGAEIQAKIVENKIKSDAKKAAAKAKTPSKSTSTSSVKKPVNVEK
jgi:hypothetical protein